MQGSVPLGLTRTCEAEHGCSRDSGMAQWHGHPLTVSAGGMKAISKPSLHTAHLPVL